MSGFDPDAYLRSQGAASQAPPAQTGFDPDLYLRGAKAPSIDRAPAPAAPPRSYAATEVPGAAMRNLPGSAKQFATGLYEAVTNPFDTLTAVLDLGAGALRKSLPDSVVQFVDRFDRDPQATQRAVEVANQVGGEMVKRYGSWDSIKRTFAEDPVGAAGDLSTLLFGGATIGRTAAGATAAAGAPTVARPMAQAAEGLGRAAVYTDPVSAVTLPAQAALGAVYQASPPQLHLRREQNAPRDEIIRRAQKEGFLIPPGSMDPTSGRYQVAERIAGKFMLEQLMSVRNQEQANRLARRYLELPESTPLTRENLQRLRQAEAEKGYTPIRNIGDIRVDDAYTNALIAIEAAYRGPSGSFPQAVPANVTKLVENHFVQNFTANDAVDIIRNLRRQANADFRRGDSDLGTARREIALALENQIERHLARMDNPNAAAMLDQFRDSRKKMAMAYSVEAALREGSGNVSILNLMRQMERKVPLEGDLDLVARFGANFGRVSQLPQQFGTPSSGAMLGTANALGAAIGAAVGNVPGAVIGSQAGLLSQIAPALMRRRLMSQSAQRAARPTYDTFAERLISDITARNALMAEQAGDVRDIGNSLMGIR